MKELQPKHFHKVLNEFDFEKVQKCMELLEWETILFNEKQGFYSAIPTVEDLKKEAINLLFHAYEHKEDCGSGGLYVKFRKGEDRETIKLYFQLESSFYDSSWDKK